MDTAKQFCVKLATSAYKNYTKHTYSSGRYASTQVWHSIIPRPQQQTIFDSFTYKINYTH